MAEGEKREFRTGHFFDVGNHLEASSLKCSRHVSLRRAMLSNIGFAAFRTQDYKSRMIDIRLLLDFAAVGETLSFSAAARSTGIAQPRLSAQIRKLEGLLGMTLFERTTRRVAFTPAGQHLFDLVRPTAKAAEMLLTDVTLLRTGRIGQLGLGMIVLGEPDRRLSGMVSSFVARHPDVDVSVETGSPEIHLKRLSERSLDLACILGGQPMEELEILPLHPIAFAVMMAQDDPLAERATILPQDFAGRRVAMVQRRRNPAFYDLHYAPLLAAGAEPVYVPELRRVLVRNMPGLLVTTLVPGAADATLRHGMVRRAVAGMPPLTLDLVRLRDAVPAPAAEAFWNYCRKVVAGPSQPNKA
ncbi:MAG: LysR family transcriptional regulator [Rhizorhabdus sp.]